jgi:serine/threonine protein phosphatase PrpC
MVLACDGIWDCFSNDDCVDFVKSRLAKGKTPLEVITRESVPGRVSVRCVFEE